jgi:dTDP-4-amino-4,6-dideoxygalactose transaminase
MSVLAINGGTPVRRRPFPAWPVWGDEEIKNLTEVVKSGKWGSLHGDKTALLERQFADLHCATEGVCINSGTTALQIALMAADVEAGAEVIVPAYTFIATATAVIEVGCVPVFVDVEAETCNINPVEIEKAITEKTAAIMPVHFAGRPANMDEILAIGRKHDLVIIEDAAQAWGAKWDNLPVGAIGKAGVFSFQSSKNINSGEGGILLTNDNIVAKMARSHSNCGRSDDGEWYEHFYYGGNYRLTEFQAAVLLAQFQRYPELHKIRLANLEYLNEKLSDIPGIEICRPDDRISDHACHIFIFRINPAEFSSKSKKSIIHALQKEGIPANGGYSLPLYKQPVFLNKSFGRRGKSVDFPIDYSAFHCPVTESLCNDQAIWLRQNMLLGTRDDMDDIVNAISKVQEQAHTLNEKIS